LGNVLLVAPETQQSGTGTGVSFSGDGINIKDVASPIHGVKAYSIGGTPSDCVILGLKHITRNHIDLVASGINLGPNVGRDIPYSGTVMATLGGYYRKIPSMAVSLALHEKNESARFDVAARFAGTVAEAIKSHSIDTSSIININVPNLPPEKIKGVKTTRTANFGYVHLADLTGSDAKAVYNTVTRKPDGAEFETGTDVWAIREGYISVTPVRIDVTHHELIPVIEECLEGLDYGYLGQSL
jgi:5'-nucleotidase